ncbi:DoxX family protein [Endozoicomonas sp. G2_1]|uniref:DoxX family protein n=1 Tax=Endozoicomonas sp. G2_1 TaxID=2821091 RepID=UPI001ADC1D2B|nr:DoxX family protein [Endozoicomonas sp. G2_1]MBO9491635.1 DoxX family protein [Endozoicomonas sp. G2_1]
MTSSKTLFFAKLLLSLILLGAGAAKLMVMPDVHLSFAVLGLPSWSGYLIGFIEVITSIGLFIRVATNLSAFTSGFILVGAFYYHAVHTPIIEAATAILALMLCFYILFKNNFSQSIR